MATTWDYTSPSGDEVTFEFRPDDTISMIVHVKRGVLRRGYSQTDGFDEEEGEVVAEVVGIPRAALLDAYSKAYTYYVEESREARERRE
jgi:hypothetical protein